MRLFLHQNRVVVLTRVLMATGFHLHARGTEPVRFNHVMTQGKAHFRCQRMHNIFHAFRSLFLHHAAAVTDKHRRCVGGLIEQMA